jgi:serine/threonine protein kinase
VPPRSSGIPVIGQSLERELAIIKTLNHPLVVKLDQTNPGAIAFPQNGSLADHLPFVKGSDLCQLHGPTRIARIVVGIVLAMQYAHSHGIIHSNLSPRKVLLDWNWFVHISGFGDSIFIDGTAVPNDSGNQNWPPLRFIITRLNDMNGQLFQKVMFSPSG